MRVGRIGGWAIVVVLGAAAFGCEKKQGPSAQPMNADPSSASASAPAPTAEIATSASPSASPSALPTASPSTSASASGETTTGWVCRDGRMMSPGEKYAESLKGSGGPIAMTSLEAKSKILSGALAESAATKAACDDFSPFEICFSSAFPGKTQLDAQRAMHVEIGADGHVSSAKTTTGAPADAKLDACLAKAAAALVLAAGPASIDLSFSYAREPAEPTLSAKSTDVTTDPGLDVETMTRFVAAERQHLVACYVKAWKKDPSCRGKVTTKVVIDAKAGVKSAEHVGGDVKDAQLQGCVVGVLKAMKVPATAGSGGATITIELGVE